MFLSAEGLNVFAQTDLKAAVLRHGKLIRDVTNVGIIVCIRVIVHIILRRFALHNSGRFVIISPVLSPLALLPLPTLNRSTRCSGGA